MEPLSDVVRFGFRRGRQRPRLPRPTSLTSSPQLCWFFFTCQTFTEKACNMACFMKYLDVSFVYDITVDTWND